ncbi:MAG: threonine ammonia-lyase [Desulfurococcaceae archaeon]
MADILDEIFEKAIKAREVLKDVVHKTPIIYNASFSRMSGNNVFLKLENMQKTGAFKVRGAYFKIYNVMEKSREKGVITASSGNHAQGVAYAANVLGIRATIVMPETTPPFKVEATKNYGATVILHGTIYDDAYKEALRIAEETEAVFIHPFDDHDVIAGQGTIGFEIAEFMNNIDAVLIPIGGGGLISGVGVVLKKLNPSIKVIGVEPAVAPKYYSSRRRGFPVLIESRPSIADALVTKAVGKVTYEIMERVVDDVVTVNEESIARAIYLLMERAKIVAEGAGASPLAALLEGHFKEKKWNVVLLVSGGNIDLTMLYRIVTKGLSADGRIHKLSLILRDVPGELYRVLGVLYKYRCNIIEILHDRIGMEIPTSHAKVDLIFEVPEPGIIHMIKSEIIALGARMIS